MATLDPTQVLRVQGRLFLDVTNLAAANYGGTPVGYFEYGEFVVDEESEDILSEATGKRTGKLVCEDVVGFEFDLVQYDKDALKKVHAFSGTTFKDPALGRTRAPGLQVPSGPCLFAATDAAHPSLLVYAPVFLAGRKRVPLGSMDEKRRERIYIDMVDSSDGAGSVYAFDILANLSLTP